MKYGFHYSNMNFLLAYFDMDSMASALSQPIQQYIFYLYIGMLGQQYWGFMNNIEHSININYIFLSGRIRNYEFFCHQFSKPHKVLDIYSQQPPLFTTFLVTFTNVALINVNIFIFLLTVSFKSFSTPLSTFFYKYIQFI